MLDDCADVGVPTDPLAGQKESAGARYGQEAPTVDTIDGDCSSLYELPGPTGGAFAALLKNIPAQRDTRTPAINAMNPR